MLIQSRILRNRSDDISPDPRFVDATTRQYQRHERIITIATVLMAEFGRHAITMVTLAAALRISPTTLRLHFTDMDALLAEILHRHLRHLSRALGALNAADPDHAKKARETYYNLSHSAVGGLNHPHLLLVRDGQSLPDDLAPAITSVHTQLGEIVGGAQARIALHLLDSAYVSLDDIEDLLAGLAERQAVRAPKELPELPPLPPAKPRNDYVRGPAAPRLDDLDPGSWILRSGIPLEEPPTPPVLEPHPPPTG